MYGTLFPSKMSSDDTDPIASNPSWWSKHIVTCLIALFTFSIDQLTKLAISSVLITGQSIPPHGFFRITLTHNSGGAFGMFPDQTTFLILSSVVGISVLVWLYIKQYFQGPLFNLSLGLQIGGALGNLINRVLQGKVVDFIDIGIWPVFNVADSAMVVGITILIFLALRRQPMKQPDQNVASSSMDRYDFTNDETL